MAVELKLTRTSLLEAEEVDGAVVRLVSQARIVGLTVNDVGVLATALATPGLPAVGSTLVDYPNLVLRKRIPKIVDDDKSTMDVDLIYEVFTNKGQSFDSPPNNVVVGRMRVEVQQVTTNLEEDGTTISVKHTYPNGDKVTQGGEVTFFQPQRTFSIEGIKNTKRPWLLATSVVGKLNEKAWSGEGPLEWLCMGAAWDIHDRNVPARYNMVFDFQHNKDTWDPLVVFKDQNTGLPPVGLVEGVGYKRVRVHKVADFELILGTRMQGA